MGTRKSKHNKGRKRHYLRDNADDLRALKREQAQGDARFIGSACTSSVFAVLGIEREPDGKAQQ